MGFSLLPVVFGCVMFLACVGSSPISSTNGLRAMPTTFAAPALLVQQRKREQLSFSVEEKPKRPVMVPKDVMQILRRDERNRRIAQGNLPKSWFVASELHLNDDDLPDLIVMAANPRLAGANIGPFWVFRNTSQGHQLILSESALVLDVLNTRTNRYRDIRLIALTATEKSTVTYKFNGSAYQPHRSSQVPINDIGANSR
jgi:hypothetical protein